MSQLLVVVTLRLDQATLDSIRRRVGDSFRVKNLSQFVREGIRLRLAQGDDDTAWLVEREGTTS